MKDPLKELKKYSNGEYVLESVTVSQRMIMVGSKKREVLIYLSGRNNTEEVANNIANLAMKIYAEAAIKDEKSTLFGGIALSLIGLGVTFATYQYAQGGGTYVVTYGIIVYGIFISGKSLLDILDIKEKEKRWKNKTL